MKMTWPRLLLYFAGVILLGWAIYFFGNKLSNKIDMNLRASVDKSTVITKAIVTRKSSHKGKSVYFKYEYKGRTYKNSEAGQFYYDNLDVGEKIEINLDSTDPGNSYIAWPEKE